MKRGGRGRVGPTSKGRGLEGVGEGRGEREGRAGEREGKGEGKEGKGRE